MRILIIGSVNPWRMEAAVERAFRRAGHDTLLIDDRRVKRLIGRRLTQRWARSRAEKFRPDFVFLSKCLALENGGRSLCWHRKVWGARGGRGYRECA